MNRIECKLKDGKFLDMDLYEIRTDEKIIYDENLLDALLFDCQCALFLIDITNHNSIYPIKQILSYIKNDRFPYLKKIIVKNKIDIMPEEEHPELKKFNNFYSSIDNLEFSMKEGDYLDELLNKIYNAINSDSPNKNLIPINNIKKNTLIETIKGEYKGSISLILVGNSAVGKSSFMKRYSNNEFNLQYISTIGIDKIIKKIKINDTDFYHLTLWDTAGQEYFRSLPKSYYKNVDGVLLLYDINDRSSFEDIRKWMKDINEYSVKTINIEAKGNKKGQKIEEDKKDNKVKEIQKIDDVIIYLIGNKIDLIDKEEEKSEEGEKGEKEGKEEKESIKVNETKEGNKKERVKKEEAEKLANELGVKYFEISCKWNLNIEEVMARIILDCYKSNRHKFQKNDMLENKKERNGCC